MPPLEKSKLVKFLEANIDVFAWSTYDVLGIDPGFMSHQLNVNHGALPRKQPPQRSSKDHAKAVRRLEPSRRSSISNGWPTM